MQCKRRLWKPRHRGRCPPRIWWERSILQWGSGCRDGTASKQLWIWPMQTLSNVPSSNQSVPQTPLCSTCRPGRRYSCPLSWPQSWRERFRQGTTADSARPQGNTRLQGMPCIHRLLNRPEAWRLLCYGTCQRRNSQALPFPGRSTCRQDKEGTLRRQLRWSTSCRCQQGSQSPVQQGSTCLRGRQRNLPRPVSLLRCTSQEDK